VTLTSLAHNRWLRVGFVLALSAGVAVLFWWRGPDWGQVGNAFTIVRWEWVVVAVGLNLLSVLVRAVAWKIVIDQALAKPHPRFMLVFSAFSIGLFANAVLPGRIGELARVGVLTRKLPGRKGAWAALLTAKVPHWAYTSLEIVLGVGFALFAFGLASARRHSRPVLDELGRVRRLLAMAGQGLSVLHSPLPAVGAAFFQCLGWFCQLLAVFFAMRAFHIYEGLPAAALVLVLVNVATIFPLWPGNIGLVQAAVALPLIAYGVPKALGIAFGFGLQAIEASVGVGVGMIFLAREGLSFAMLRVMPGAEAVEMPEDQRRAAESRERARISG